MARPFSPIPGPGGSETHRLRCTSRDALPAKNEAAWKILRYLRKANTPNTSKYSSSQVLPGRIKQTETLYGAGSRSQHFIFSCF
ncbi:uncharacterized protein LOC101747773 isoform X2 [Gallus gallus]|uniref:uncharacterized protein LOC101747773 isoform X2 n=1 Tax=Gallus gallus TaxID=9031 RepID=UPI001F003CCA|nr:uncharacterized protein LOC101747773 isoform X2 [Gallus gallus]